MNASCKGFITLHLMDLHPNCTDLAVVIAGYIVPGMAVITLMLNLPIVIVFTKPHVRSHTTLILTLIACADTLNIICPTYVYVYHYTFGHYVEYLAYSKCELTYILVEICVDMFNMISLWLTVLLAYIRCMCLKSPFATRHIHSGKRILTYVAFILLLAVCVYLPSLFVFEFTPVQIVDPVTNTTMEVCGVAEPDGLFLIHCSRRKVHILVKTMVESLIPCCFLVYYNAEMCLVLSEAKQSRTSLRCSESTTRDSSKKKTYAARTADCAARTTISCDYHIDRDDVFYDDTGNHSNNTERGNIICQFPCFMGKYNRKLCQSGTCLGCSCGYHNSFRKKVYSTDSAFDKLDRDSRRASWLIVLVSTIVVVHEIPLAIANVYALATHVGVPLPINIYGCYSFILLLWQYITYPVIFLIYACMSKTFRSELWKTITLPCQQPNPIVRRPNKLFLSPCSVRKRTHLDIETTAGHSADNEFHNDNDSSVCDMAKDDGKDSEKDSEFEINTIKTNSTN